MSTYFTSPTKIKRAYSHASLSNDEASSVLQIPFTDTKKGSKPASSSVGARRSFSKRERLLRRGCVKSFGSQTLMLWWESSLRYPHGSLLVLAFHALHTLFVDTRYLHARPVHLLEYALSLARDLVPYLASWPPSILSVCNSSIRQDFYLSFFIT
jgi:hypothetical protein